MKIQEAQDIVHSWITSTGVRYFNELTNTAVLMEEVGELARLMARKYGEQSFKKDEAEHQIGEEIADVMFVLICIANQTGVDLTRALKESIEKKTARDSKRHMNNPKLK
ncbi:MAG: nucleotide pyrophosphohydrolase [Bacteroidetes bacterium]|nr:nucleotide pyrophosphohydrolase [Bacteroidota bacterium]MBL6964167.1 nucleotide pyrophosphohydrolase [Bacteroidota bacterium]